MLFRPFVLTLFISFLSLHANDRCLTIEKTIMGPQKICDPFIIKTIKAPIMQRLKGVDQSGLPHYFNKSLPQYTRFEHCIGVYLITRKAHESEKRQTQNQKAEQLAALLHDASHTVFSHTGDFVFSNKNYHHDHSYQDHIHLWFLEKMGIKELLKGTSFTLKELDPDLPQYKALEQSYPDMCADRIEYNLHTALVFGKITLEEIQEILNSLYFKDGKWFFTNKAHAKRFASFSLYFTEHFWSSPFNEVLNHLGAKLIKRALKLNIITEDDLHFGQDNPVLEKIKSSCDSEIQELLKKLETHDKHYKVGTKENHTYHRVSKFRGIDPWVQTSKNAYQRLTNLDPDFKKEFQRVQQKIKEGLYLIIE